MKLLLLVALLGVAYVAAECPEACNGHGFCGEYDKCSCYRNWQGNSCADRTCPFDLAFVDIPHGDLNMNGKLDDEITLYGAQINDVYAFEVYPTDGYQINRGGRCSVTTTTKCSENSDCPSSQTCNFDLGTDDSGDDSMYTALTAREKAASFYDMAEDGHFYAECSNKGMCDRKSGQCDCFDGYSGTACRRVACPNDCSGHGTCETIGETDFDYVLWDRYKTQVCSCDPGYFGIDCAQRHCPYGDDPLSTDEHNEIQWLTLRTHGDGTSGPGDAASTYSEGDLDLEGTFRLAYKDEYGETWNTSPIQAHSYETEDYCSVATCGDGDNEACTTKANCIAETDGEWTVGATENANLAAAIKAALEGIPNSVFEEVDVELWPIQTPLPGLWDCNGSSECVISSLSATNHKVTGSGTIHTNFMKTSEQTSSPITGGIHKWGVSNCMQRGYDADGDGTDDSEFAAAAKFDDCSCSGGTSDGNEEDETACGTASGTWSCKITGAGMGGLSDAETHKLCRYDMNGFRAKITFTKNPGDINELTCDADLVTTGEHKDSADPATDIVCTAKDYNNFELGAIGTMVGSVIGGGNGGRITTNMGLTNMVTHGDRIRFAGVCSEGTTVCYSDDDCVETCSDDDDGTAPKTYTIAGPVNEPVAPDSGTDSALANIIVEEETTTATAITAVHTPAVLWWGRGTTENVECSHRGLCNHDEGLCECFTGYTHDDCSMQDALNA